jgi:hypothetical protein
MIPVIDEMYGAMAAAFGDANLVSPFQEGGGRSPNQDPVTTLTMEDDCGCDEGIVLEESLPRYQILNNVVSGGYTSTATGNVVTFPATNVTITFGTPLPPDVVESMGEMKKAYGPNGCHLDNGFCVKCGY